MLIKGFEAELIKAVILLIGQHELVEQNVDIQFLDTGSSSATQTENPFFKNCISLYQPLERARQSRRKMIDVQDPHV
jgi:hypothetical protein